MNTDNTEQLNRIESKLDALEKVLLTPKRLRSNLKPLDAHSHFDREGEVKRVFDLSAATPTQKKQGQHFPEGTWNRQNDRIEIIPRSILVNRCSLRKAFRPTQDELGKKNTVDIVNEVIDKMLESGKYVQGRLLDAINIKGNSNALCIFSPKAAEKGGLKPQGKKEPETPWKNYLPGGPLHKDTVYKTPVVEPWIPGKDYSKKVVESEDDDEEWEDEAEKPKGHSGMVWQGVSTETTQKPLETASTEQETLSEEALIREMREVELSDLIDDDDVVFERSTEKERRKL